MSEGKTVKMRELAKYWQGMHCPDELRDRILDATEQKIRFKKHSRLWWGLICIPIVAVAAVGAHEWITRGSRGKDVASIVGSAGDDAKEAHLTTSSGKAEVGPSGIMSKDNHLSLKQLQSQKTATDEKDKDDSTKEAQSSSQQISSEDRFGVPGSRIPKPVRMKKTSRNRDRDRKIELEEESGKASNEDLFRMAEPRSPSELSKQVEAYIRALKMRGWDDEESLTRWRALKKEWPQSPFVHEMDLQIIKTLIRLKRFDEAKKQAEAFLRTYPNSPKASEISKLIIKIVPSKKK